MPSIAAILASGTGYWENTGTATTRLTDSVIGILSVVVGGKNEVLRIESACSNEVRERYRLTMGISRNALFEIFFDDYHYVVPD
jgi:hypothetical protein